MSKKLESLVAKLSPVAAVLVALAGCTSTLGLEDYELTELDRCDDTLVDRASDPENCGTCGNVCPTGSDCVAGTCTCPEGERFCADTESGAQECADIERSEEHCGACGETCAQGASCRSGACECDETGQTVCSDVCVDLETDEDNCGRCGTACAIGASCVNGQCECDVSGEIACQGACTNPMSDVAHCGGCDHACSITNATPMCSSGECVSSQCQGDYLDCDNDLDDGEAGNGCEIDSQTDDAHCGACNNPCPIDRTCEGGMCVCDVPAAGGDCDPRSNCGCDAGTNCAYENDTWACITAGFYTETSTCTQETDCAVGYGCVAGVCHRRCNEQEIEDGACGNYGSCIQVVDANGDDIDGYQICAEPCNPSLYDPTPPGTTDCPAGQQCIVGGGVTACAQAGTVYGDLGYACTSYLDCQPGFDCIDGTCQPYCLTAYDTCGNYGFGYTCTSFAEPAFANEMEVGFCDNPLLLDCLDTCTPGPGFNTCPPNTACLNTAEYGWVCMPSQCQTCFNAAQVCNWNTDSCTFNYCSP